MEFKNFGSYIDPIFNNGLEQKIMYVHVPKCGGISIGKAILKKIGFWRRLRGKGLAGISPNASKRASELLDESPQELRRKILIYNLNKPGNTFVKGHVSVNSEIIKEFNDEWNFITILRDPVERWYSEYFYNRFKNSDHFKTDLKLEEYVSSKRGLQTGRKYVAYFSGAANCNNANIKLAKENLSKFRIVGLLENTTDFKKKFKSLFNTQLSIKHKNKSPAPIHVREDISSSMHDEIVKICQPDIEIYNWAKNNLIEYT